MSAVAGFEVCGVPKAGGEPLVMRRFTDEAKAVNHALAADMSAWDDVFVRPASVPVPADVTEPPPRPWTVLWTGAFAYIIDANGKKLASLLGPQAQREFVAAAVCDGNAP